MRIATVKKAHKLRRGDRVLVLDAEGQPSWNTVISNEPSYDSAYRDVRLEGIVDEQDIAGNSRVVVWS